MNSSSLQEQRSSLKTQFDLRRLSQHLIAAPILLVAVATFGAASLHAQATGDPLFIDKQGQVGIGTNQPGAPLDVNGDAIFKKNVGIGNAPPKFPLSFPNVFGDKISFWDQAEKNYGIGIQQDQLQIHTDYVGSDIVFGYGTSSSSTSLTKTMWIKGNGNVGIGKDPTAKLDVNGSALFRATPTIMPDSNGLAVLSLGEPAGARLQLQYKAESGKHKIGLADGHGTWRFWSENESGDASIAGGLLLPNKWEIRPYKENRRVDGKNIMVEGLGFYRDKKLMMEINDGARLRYNYPKHGMLYMDWGRNDYSYWTRESDYRLKTDIHAIPSALEKVNKLRGVTYHWNQAGLDYLTRDIEQTTSAGTDATPEANQKLWQNERLGRYKELKKTNVGVVAQEVEAVLPEAITTDDAGYKQVRYDELIPLLIEALKEEDTRSQEQAKAITSQQAEIQRLSDANESARKQLAEMEEMKQKLASVEDSMNRIVAAERSRDRKDLTVADRSAQGVPLGSN